MSGASMNSTFRPQPMVLIPRESRAARAGDGPRPFAIFDIWRQLRYKLRIRVSPFPVAIHSQEENDSLINTSLFMRKKVSIKLGFWFAQLI